MAAVLDLRISSLNEALARMERAGLVERIAETCRSTFDEDFGKREPRSRNQHRSATE